MNTYRSKPIQFFKSNASKEIIRVTKEKKIQIGKQYQGLLSLKEGIELLSGLGQAIEYLKGETDGRKPTDEHSRNMQDAQLQQRDDK